MREIQTPQRDQSSANRSTKSKCSSDPRKVMKKSLNPAFKAVSEEGFTVTEFLKEFPEVSVNDQFGESAENFIAAYPVDTDSSKTVAISDLTLPSPSSEITSDKHAFTNARDTKLGGAEIESDHKIESYETEVVIKHLREARIQVMKSKDLGPSKKLLDATIKIVIQEFYGGLYEDKEWLDKLASNKGNLVSLIFMMGVFAALVFWFFNSGTKGFVNMLPPT
ncbi:hypothetical protein ABFS82_02G075000 [Erythranthe guttata]|uniref:Uncharacterized protein n=1 Tax=Erythranthe guttata TaxID=4155 RepID=A0A022QCU1_ERYGU|nr:hypothetical protein MIMGU_mgv1a022819mg [Erythranthe guttata]